MNTVSRQLRRSNPGPLSKGPSQAASVPLDLPFGSGPLSFSTNVSEREKAIVINHSVLPGLELEGIAVPGPGNVPLRLHAGISGII